MTPDSPEKKPASRELTFHEGDRGFDTKLNTWFEIISIDAGTGRVLLRYDCSEEGPIQPQCSVSIDYVIKNCGFGVEDDERAKYERAQAESLDTTDGPRVTYDDPRFRDETGAIAKGVRINVDRRLAN